MIGRRLPAPQYSLFPSPCGWGKRTFHYIRLLMSLTGHEILGAGVKLLLG